jgi:5-(carboxyamino)imidazole ribonucleotide synthase
MSHNPTPDLFYVYIMSCADDTYYTGLTDDLVKKFEEHINGSDKKSETFGKWPFELKYYETCPNLEEAVARQANIKEWSDQEKIALFETTNALPLLNVCNAITRVKTSPIKKEVKRAGILGGGQLGRMLLQAAANYSVETFVMENDSACPSAHLCHHFIKGDITKF